MPGYQLDLKPIIRVSKSAIRNVIGRMLDYSSTYEYAYTIKQEKCQQISCPIQLQYAALEKIIRDEKQKDLPDITKIRDTAQKLKEIASQCAASGCAFAQVNKIYQNDRKHYNLYTKEYRNRRLPKSALRMYLLLYAIPQELLGEVHFIRDINLEVLADVLDINIATAKKSLEMLSAFHYITLSHAASSTSYNIIITDYDSMHLTAKKGGTGYFTLTDSMMHEILSITNVNALRLEILKILKDDDSSLRHQEVSEYTIRDLTNVLPSHMNYQNYYRNIDATQPSLFTSTVYDGKLSFTLKNGYSLRLSIDDFELSHLHTFREYISSIHLELTELELLNVCELCCEFTVENIKASISSIKRDYIDHNLKVKSFGALLRTYCRSNYISTSAA